MIEGKPRLMVIGLDGAAPDLLFPWIQAGYLPHLERIFSDGFHGRLRSTVHPQSPQAWSSIYTGVNPGSHGIFGFSTGPFSDHPGEFVTALNRRARDFWSFPEFRNTRIGLINLPFTYPVTAVNGFVLSGFGTPSLSKKYSYPAGISQISKRLIGRYPITGADISTRSADGYARSLWDMDRRRAELAPHLMDRFNIDILFIVFESCDRIQHALWNELDVLSPWTRANDEGIKSTFIFKTYKLIDDLCGQLLGSIPRDCAVMIVSDHGAGPCYGIFNLAEWLIQNGFLKQTKGPISGRFSSTSRKILTSLRSRIPSTAVAMMSPWLRTTWRKHLYSVSQLNLAQSYALPHESFGSIYLNSKHEGESYRIGEEICSGLLQLKDPYNQAPLFSKIHRREDLYSGVCVSDSPDLIFGWRSYRYTTEPVLYPTKQLFLPPSTWAWSSMVYSGFHRRDGIILGYVPNRKVVGTLFSSTVLDIVPTICDILDIECAEQLEGISLINPTRQRRQQSDVMSPQGPSPCVLTNAEKQKMQEHLVKLGYW